MNDFEGFKMTELGLVPEEWGVVKFEDARLKKRVKIGKIKQQQYKKMGKYPVVDQSQSFIAGYTDEDDKVYQGDLPIIIFGDHTRVFKFVDFPFVAGADGTKIILPDNNKFNPKFLYFTSLNLKIENRGYNRHYSMLREKRVPLPPLPEQHRIAAVLSAVQDAKEKTEAVIAAAKSLKKSLMHHLFTYGPVPAGAAESVPLKETEIGLVPEGWEIFQTKDVCSLIIDCPHSTPKFTESGILVVRTSNVRDGKLVLNSPSFTSEEEYKERIKRGIPEEGDIIFTREAPIGEACLIPSDLKLCLGQRMMLLRPDKFLLNGYFLVQAFCSKQVKGAMLVQGKGVTAKHLNVADVKRLLFPLPSLPTQQKIAHILSTVDKKIETEENKKKALDELFRSLLHNLMTAKIRVNHLDVVQ